MVASPQVVLDHAHIDAGREPMGGIAVAQRMNADATFDDAGGTFCLLESALDAGDRHGLGCAQAPVVSSAQRRKEKGGIAVHEPIPAKQLKGFRGHGNIAVLGALAAMDMDHVPLAVDVGDLQGEGF